VVVREGLWVIEGVNDYGEGQVFTVVLTIELKDGKMRCAATTQSRSRRQRGGGTWSNGFRRLQDFLWVQSWTSRRFSTLIVRPIPSALHSLTLFLCIVRSNSVIMCT